MHGLLVHFWFHSLFMLTFKICNTFLLLVVVVVFTVEYK